MRWLWIVLAVAVIAGAILLPIWLSPFHTRVAQLFFFSAGLAVAWNILGGFAGYWSFGHTVFIGIGGFAAAHFATRVGTLGPNPLSMVVPVLVAALVSAAFAAVIAYPLLRLRGIYFAIAMLGVGIVVAELFNSIHWFQGGIGVFLAPAVPSGMRPEVFYYYVFGALLLIAFATSLWVRSSRFGYGLLAIREDEDTAGMLGVPAEKFKIAAFVLSATLVGALGGAYAYSIGYFTTNTLFRMDFSLNMIVYCLIGGIGTRFGPILGAALMLVVTQLFLSRLLDIHLLITGLIVVAIVLLMPRGILGTFRPGAWPRNREEPTEQATGERP